MPRSYDEQWGGNNPLAGDNPATEKKGRRVPHIPDPRINDERLEGIPGLDEEKKDNARITLNDPLKRAKARVEPYSQGQGSRGGKERPRKTDADEASEESFEDEALSRVDTEAYLRRYAVKEGAKNFQGRVKEIVERVHIDSPLMRQAVDAMMQDVKAYMPVAVLLEAGSMESEDEEHGDRVVIGKKRILVEAVDQYIEGLMEKTVWDKKSFADYCAGLPLTVESIASAYRKAVGDVFHQLYAPVCALTGKKIQKGEMETAWSALEGSFHEYYASHQNAERQVKRMRYEAMEKREAEEEKTGESAVGRERSKDDIQNELSQQWFRYLKQRIERSARGLQNPEVVKIAKKMINDFEEYVKGDFRTMTAWDNGDFGTYLQEIGPGTVKYKDARKLYHEVYLLLCRLDKRKVGNVDEEFNQAWSADKSLRHATTGAPEQMGRYRKAA